MNKERFRDTDSEDIDSVCPMCRLSLQDHNVTQLVQCIVDELSKNKTKKMFEQQNHILYSNIKSSRKGGPVFE